MQTTRTPYSVSFMATVLLLLALLQIVGGDKLIIPFC